MWVWPSSLLPPQVGHLLGQALASWPVCPQMVQVTVGVVLLAPELLLEGVLELLAGVLLLPEDAVLLEEPGTGVGLGEGLGVGEAVGSGSSSSTLRK